MLAAGRAVGRRQDERPYLPRAFSFARARPLGDAGVELDFLLEDVGPGTHRLAAAGPGRGADAARAARRGLRRRRRPAPGRCSWAAASAPRRSWRSTPSCTGAAPALLGFRSAAHAEAAALFDEAGGDGEAPLVVTDDGSAGRRGLVTEPLRELIDRDPAVTVYACGPPADAGGGPGPVRGARGARPARAGGRHGLRLRRLLRLRGAHRAGATMRVCVDGPVVDAAALDAALHP